MERRDLKRTIKLEFNLSFLVYYLFVLGLERLISELRFFTIKIAGHAPVFKSGKRETNVGKN
jgi:hypothetical protein